MICSFLIEIPFLQSSKGWHPINHFPACAVKFSLPLGDCFSAIFIFPVVFYGRYVDYFAVPNSRHRGRLPMASWQMDGDYFETCSCDYVCPCVPTNMAGKPTMTWCNFAMVFHIDRGNSDGIKLDGLSFAVIGHTPDIMG